jgi:hypothetical protein
LVERWFPKPKDRGSSPFFPAFIGKKSIKIFHKIFNFFFKLKKSPKRKKNIKTNNKICLKLIFFIKFTLSEAYSSVVERTAHNGLVVGSNPTKPNKNIIITIIT